MKTFLLICLVSQSLFAHYALRVRYHFGNQVASSELTIDNTGIVRIKEYACCGSPAKETGKSLSSSQLVELNSWLEAAEAGAQETKVGNKTMLGSSSGYLMAQTKTGQEFNVRTISRSEKIMGDDKVVFNRSSEAEKIEELVESFVEHKMYR